MVKKDDKPMELISNATFCSAIRMNNCSVRRPFFDSPQLWGAGSLENLTCCGLSGKIEVDQFAKLASHRRSTHFTRLVAPEQRPEFQSH